MSSPARRTERARSSGVRIAHCEIGDDQIELRIGSRQIERFRATRDVRDPGNLPQVQLKRFVNEQFVEPPVLAQDEGIVQARNQQNVLHAEWHQVLETFKALFGVENGLGDTGERHGINGQ